MAKNTEKNSTAFALQFLGGLVFLAVAWQLWGVASTPAAWVGGLLGGAFLATVFYAVAVVSAVTLLLTSFAQLGSRAGMAGWKAMKTTTVAVFVLAVLTVTNPTWLVVTLVGFVIASAGSVSAMMSMDWKSMK